MKITSTAFTAALAVSSLSAVVHAAICEEEEDLGCIPEDKPCTGKEDECCGEEGRDMGCFGYNFFKTCQEVPTCLGMWQACNTDGHTIECCGDMICVQNEAGTHNECQVPTIETTTRSVEIPAFDVKNEEEDPPVSPKPNLKKTPKPDPMEFWVGCIKGDPHVTTFDGQKYDCHGVGEFIAAKSGTTQRQIQARFRPYKTGSDISVMRGMTVQDEGDTPKVQLQVLQEPDTKGIVSTSINDQCKIQLFVNDVQKELEGGYYDGKIDIKYDGGDITVKYLESGMWMDIQISNSCRFSTCWNIPKGDPTLVGLLGSPDGNVKNDWMKPDGKLADEDISRAGDDDYAYGYCVKNWCINDRAMSLFKYNEGGWDFDAFNSCELPFGVSVEEFTEKATPELLNVCKNDEQCVKDGLMDGIPEVRNFHFDDKEQKKQVRGEGGRCNPGSCKEGLECVDFGGLVGSKCAKKDKNFCHPKKAGCGPALGHPTCCGDLQCVELNNGQSMCKNVKDDEGCRKKKKGCSSNTDCCNGLTCYKPDDKEFGWCLEDKKSKKGDLCGPKGCEDGLACFEGKCVKVEAEIKKKGAPCGEHDPLKKNRSCEGDLKCVPADGITKCAKVKEEKLSCKRACSADLPCCDGDVCMEVEEKKTKQKVMQCRKNKVKGKKNSKSTKESGSSKDSKSTKDDDDDELTTRSLDGIPKPDKCVLKRAKEILMYEPNFPEGRPDVYIEVEIEDGRRFQFYPKDYPEYEGGQIPVVDKEVFQILFDEQEKLGGAGFKLRYVSKNGEGAWNSCKYSPIALDLNGSGNIERIKNDVGFEIDITGDGDKEHLREWFAPTEGILIDVKSKEGKEDYKDGIITGHHLIGDQGGQYADGFEKLATYDDNDDGKISGNELKGLYLWVDANSNLIIDEGEEKELGDYGIVALSTTHDNLKSYAELEDGSKMLMEDLWFNPFRRRNQ